MWRVIPGAGPSIKYLSSGYGGGGGGESPLKFDSAARVVRVYIPARKRRMLVYRAAERKSVSSRARVQESAR